MTTDEFVSKLEKEPLVKKYMYKHTWLSGSSTTVYPITIWDDLKEIVIQWDSRKNIFNKFIQRMVDESEGLVRLGYFNKKDGTCPATIVFKLN